MLITRLGGPGYWKSLRSAQCISPASVPIQRLPSRAPSRPSTLRESARSPSLGAQGTKRTPSKRKSPCCVPIQRYPSVVCAIARGAPLKTPSCNLHTECPYCDICRLGSTAHAVQAAQRKRKLSRSEWELFNPATLLILSALPLSQDKG